MTGDFDLLGDPIPEGWGRRGRPAHLVTEEKRKLVITLAAFDWSMERIAAALSITPPTLRKNYFRELRAKAEARARVEAMGLATLMTQVEAGNTSAIALLFKRLDRHDLAAPRPKEKVKVPVLGKKAAAKIEAGNKPQSWGVLVN